MSDQQSHFRLMEALLFAAVEPLDEATLSERLPDGADVPALLAQLAEDYADRGVNLVRTAGRWALRTADDLAPYLRKHVDVQRKLSRAAVETLAIIAYHQPITRAEVEALRGVSLSRGTLDILVETGWVRPGRRRRTPGRPATWLTTDTFLDHFSLDSLDDLPGVEELRAAGLLDARQGTLGFDIGGADAQAEGGEAAVDQAEADDEAADPDA